MKKGTPTQMLFSVMWNLLIKDLLMVASKLIKEYSEVNDRMSSETNQMIDGNVERGITN